MPFEDLNLSSAETSTLTASPQEHTPARPGNVEFYNIDSRGLRLAEWLRSTGLLTAIIGWTCGRAGISLTTNQRAPLVDDWSETEISAGDVPADVREQFAPCIAQLMRAGFREPLWYRLVNRFNGYEDIGALLAAPSGDSVARIFLSRALPGYKVRPRFETSIITALSDGRFLWTCDLPPRFDFAPNVITQRPSNVPLSDWWKWHVETARKLTGGALAARTATSAEVLALHGLFESNDSAFNVKRGVFKAPSPAELAADAHLVNAEREAAASGTRFPDAWAELQHLQAPKRGMINGFLLLVITLVAFAGRDVIKSSYESIGVIVGVLLVHELGHYLAMRLFRYRELRMFFLPMFGAAVSGKHYNVPGWKKAIVSLMGPVPGIFIGAAIGAYAIFSGNETLANASLVAMGLNVFNLLPILPFDGGWFWNAVLFSRNRWLEAAFKTLAGVIAVFAGTRGYGRIWLYIGIATLITVPATVMTGKVVARLRRQGFRPLATDDDTMPISTADTIFSELNAVSKGVLKGKALATSGLQVFERINATPPNWLETIGLSAVYFVSIAVAIAGLALVSVYRIFPDKAFNDAAHVEHAVKPPPTLNARYNGEFHHMPAAKPDEKAARRLLFATFPTSEAAASAYAKFCAEPPAAAEFEQFGQSILLSIRARKDNPGAKLTETLRSAGATVFDSEDSAWFRINLAVTAPDASTATEIEHEITTWLRMSWDLRPVAPWNATEKVDAATREAIRRSCETYLKIEDAKRAVVRSTASQKRDRWSLVSMLFSSNKPERYREMAAESARAQRAAVVQLQASRDPSVDQAIIAHELQRPPLPATDYTALKKWRGAMRQLITHEAAASSQNPADNEDEDENNSSGWNKAERTASEIVLNGTSYGLQLRDLPTLADWLVARGCTGVRYGIDAGSAHNLSD